MKRSTNKKRRRGARLGQHFLKNVAAAKMIADAANIQKNDVVLEIGPGKGILTRAVLDSGAKVVAVEKDSEMVSLLQERFKKEITGGQLEIYETDIRNFSPETFFKKQNYTVAANIPYYITGELLRTYLSTILQPTTIVFLVQKEVAERIARSKKESLLSLSVKAYGTPKYVKTVTRGNFSPPPSVDSAILLIQNISRKNFHDISEEIFFKVVKAGFAAKRKTLSGNLKKVFGERARGALTEVGIPEKARAEDVPLSLWFLLAKKLDA